MAGPDGCRPSIARSADADRSAGRPDLGWLVAGLRPTGGPPFAGDDGRAASALGVHARAWAAELAGTTATMIARSVPDEPDLRLAEIRRVGADMLERILLELAGQVTSDEFTDDQKAIADDTAARGIPFDRIVAALRLAQSHWTSSFLDVVEASGRWDAARAVIAAVNRQVDVVVNASIKEYLRERERLLTSAEARRRELVTALIEGRPVDAGECRHVLGIDLLHHHLAVIIHDLSGSPGAAADMRLTQTAGRVARALGARTSMVHRPAPDAVWLWASHPREVNVDGLVTLEPVARRLELRLSVGSVRAGLTGVRDSHHDALAADRVPLPGNGGPFVVRYDDVDLPVLLAADMEHARRFVRDHLGDLARSDPQIDELRETLVQYYRANMSPLTAAGPLHVHRNTVVYRLRRIEQIIGHPVTEGVLGIQSALALATHFGRLVLGESPDDGAARP